MRILVIDDEYFAIEAMQSILNKLLPDSEIVLEMKQSKVMDHFADSPFDVVFTDIQMPGISGISLAKGIKQLYPSTNIIFTTGYSEHALEAYQLNASGYLLKPITEEAVEEQIKCLRYPVSQKKKNRVSAKCFGNFEIYVDGQILDFKYEKIKEMMAYLIDRDGAGCTNKEIMAFLWEDDNHKSYLSNIKKDLMDSLSEHNCENIIESSWGSLGVKRELIDCDYFDWKDGKSQGINAYHGEYMAQYSWSEFSNSLFKTE